MNVVKFGAMFNFPENVKTDYDNLVQRVTRKMAVQFVDKFDYYIACQIAQTARNSGISDLAVIDEKMVLEMLKKQIPVKPFIYQCPCGKFVDKGWNYCPDCGQAFDWGAESV